MDMLIRSRTACGSAKTRSVPGRSGSKLGNKQHEIASTIHVSLPYLPGTFLTLAMPATARLRMSMSIGVGSFKV